MISVRFNVTDNATPALKRKMAGLQPHVMATRVAVAAARVWRDHLAALPKNKHGYPSTGFWEDAARRVRGIADGGNVVLSSDKIGLRQRYFGGQIPKGGKGPKMLTIPICAEAYGTSASDWGDQLMLVCIGARRFLALYLGSQAANDRFKKTLGTLTSRAETTVNRVRKYAAESVDYASKKPDVIFLHKGGGAMFESKFISLAQLNFKLKFMFVLKDTVMQEGNPDVVPIEKLKQTALQVVSNAVKNN
jgi:hypothetical protein